MSAESPTDTVRTLDQLPAPNADTARSLLGLLHGPRLSDREGAGDAA
jgi:hypothetical protein